jgi:hypothetical protein
VNWRLYDVEQFRIEMDVERQHGSHESHPGVSHDDPLITGMHALAHLKECPDPRAARADGESETRTAARWRG